MKDKETQLAELVEKSRALLDDNLKSVVVYGSAATGEHVAKASDLNTMLVLDRIDGAVLAALSPFVSKWCRGGNPPPLLMTAEEIRTSSDVFPMEFLDIRDAHRVLLGDDPFEGLEIDPRNLRLQCEHELRGKIIRLREQYLLAGGKAPTVRDLMIRSISTFVALFRGALRVLSGDAPMARRDVLRRTAETVELDLSVLEKVLDLKEGRVEIRGDALRELFGEYLRVVERVAERVDRHFENARA
jgi:hypothetical protein